MGEVEHIFWAQRSPDLTPLDFFLWGHIKTNIYKTRIKDLNDSKAPIIQQIQLIEKQTLHDVFLEIVRRLNLCISLEGNTFEQYL